MKHAWYERVRDQKDHVFFELHRVDDGDVRSYYRAPSFHNAVEFSVCLEGSVEIDIDQCTYQLKAGEICFINSLETHLFYYSPNTVCYIILISRDFFNNVNRLGSISFPPHMKCTEGFDAIKAYLDYAIKHWDPDSLLCKRAFVDMLAYLMICYYPYFPKKEPEKQSVAILNAVAYICEHYTEQLRLSEIASRFDYSPCYFSTAFNAFVGSSFTDYVNTRRMIEYYRLRREDPTLSAIRAAEMCGFGSMKSFYRACKKFEDDSAVIFNPPRKTIF